MPDSNTPLEPAIDGSPRRLSSAAGLSVEVLANGAIRRIESRGVTVNLFLGNEVEGGPANLWLRCHGAAGIEAIAPVCGFGDPDDVCRLRNVPVRAYHGAADIVVPLARQQECVDALRACGGTAEFIVFPGVGHDAWNPAYDDPALVPWLMAQVRR